MSFPPFDYSKTYYKIINEWSSHRGFQYKDGLNIDTQPFNPKGMCLGGGLYFASRKTICRHIHLGLYVCEVKVPLGIPVYHEEIDKWKASQLIVDLKQKKSLYEFPWTEEDIQEKPELIQYISPSRLTMKMCEIAVQHSGYLLQYVLQSFRTPQLIEQAIENEPHALRFVKNPSSALCFKAVSRKGNAIQHIKDPIKRGSAILCKAAVQSSGIALQYVPEQTEDLCLWAVKTNGFALCFVNKQTEQICYEAVYQNPEALKFVKSPFKTDKLCCMAISLLPASIRYIDEPTEQQKHLYQCKMKEILIKKQKMNDQEDDKDDIVEEILDIDVEGIDVIDVESFEETAELEEEDEEEEEEYENDELDLKLEPELEVEEEEEDE